MSEKRPYQYFIQPLRFVALLWVIKFFEIYSGIELDYLGILPRTFTGLKGIVFAPLIHAGFYHLLSNTFPLLVLGWMLMYFYPQSSRRVFINVYFFTGVLVWIFGRQHYHIGASGVVYGLAFFLFVSSLIRNDKRSLAITFFIIFMYGGLVWGLLPLQEGISWESHLGGAISGAVMAFVCRDMDKEEIEPSAEEEEDKLPTINYKYTYVPKNNDEKQD